MEQLISPSLYLNMPNTDPNSLTAEGWEMGVCEAEAHEWVLPPSMSWGKMTSRTSRACRSSDHLDTRFWIYQEENPIPNGPDKIFQYLAKAKATRNAVFTERQKHTSGDVILDWPTDWNHTWILMRDKIPHKWLINCQDLWETKLVLMKSSVCFCGWAHMDVSIDIRRSLTNRNPLPPNLENYYRKYSSQKYILLNFFSAIYKDFLPGEKAGRC